MGGGRWRRLRFAAVDVEVVRRARALGGDTKGLAAPLEFTAKKNGMFVWKFVFFHWYTILIYPVDMANRGSILQDNGGFHKISPAENCDCG